MLSVSSLFLIYLIVLNLLGFSLMGMDKQRARRQRTLFLAALLGGSVGALTGMYFFRHKTKHWYFVIGIPAILILQAGLAAVILYLQPVIFSA